MQFLMSLFCLLVVLSGCQDAERAAVSQTAAPETGAVLFSQNCAGCHGQNGGSRIIMGGLQSFQDKTWQKTHSEQALIATITHGKESMPSFENSLTPQQIQLIAAYLRHLPQPTPE
jgi:mono/diheme cytochrome c family protein